MRRAILGALLPLIGLGCARNESRISAAASAVVIDDQRANTFPTGTYFSLTGLRYIAYAGTDSNHQVNIISSPPPPSGSDGSWSPPQIISDDQVNGDGAVSIAAFKGRLYYAFNGTDRQINIRSSPDGVNWTKEVVSNATSPYAPMLVAFGGRLVVAYTGEGAGALNVFSSPDGNFHGDANLDDKNVLGQQTPHAPALASFNGKLYIGWTGTGAHNLDWAEVVDFGNGGLQNLVVVNETSDDGVGLLGFGNKLVLSWRGSGNENINYAALSASDVASLTAQGGNVSLPAGTKVISSDTSDHTPTFADFFDSAALLWTGTDADRHVNVTENVFSLNPACADGTVSTLDSDNDGFLDCWETEGIDFDGDGVVDLNLPALGANPAHKDIFVEIDSFACSVAGGDCAAGDTHTHVPMAGSVTALVNAFAAAPVSNPDGTTGINLHLQIDDTLPHQTLCAFDKTCFDVIKQSNFGTAAERGDPNSANILAAKRFAFHYSLWVHDQPPAKNSVSGISEEPGNDILISLGEWTAQTGSVAEQSGTLMHELGHNLGLNHGGGDGINYKPNYLSVMSYAFQTIGMQPSGVIDYSRLALASLVETSLSESAGIGDGALSTVFICPNESVAVGAGNAAIDWDCNGDTTGVGIKTDINRDDECIGSGKDGTLQSTPSGDDVVAGGTIGPGPDGTLETVPSGDDVVVGNQIQPGPDGVIETTPAGDDVLSGEVINDGPNRTCETTAAGDDGQTEAVGWIEPANLNGYDDWSNLSFNFRTASDFPDGVHTTADNNDIDAPTATQIEIGSTVADLTITQTASSAVVSDNSQLSYTIVLTNNGPKAARLPTVSDRLPAGTAFVSCTATNGGSCGGAGNFRTVVFDPLPSGGSATILFTTLVTCAVPDGTQLINRSTVAAASFDPTPADDGATTTVLAEIAAPTIHDFTVDKTSLWPPNHKMVEVTASYTVTDPCDPNPVCGLTVASNENDGTQPEWIVDDAHHVRLRAERDGNGSGRVYTITATCTNNHGKSTTTSATVAVPHNQ